MHLKFPPSGRLLAVHSSILKDPICEEVKKLWPKENGNLLKLNGIRMGQFCHKNLLWCYRNSLMHEYRNPGRGVEGKDDNKPFYQELKTASNWFHRLEEKKWDKELERDIEEGRLDDLAQEALKEYNDKKYTEL